MTSGLRVDGNAKVCWCGLPRFSGSRFCKKHHLERYPSPSASAFAGNGKIEKPDAGRVMVSDPPIVVKKKRGRPPKANNVGGINESGVSDPSIEKKIKQRPLYKSESSEEEDGSDDDEDDDWEAGKAEEERLRVSRARVSNCLEERKKCGRPSKKKMPKIEIEMKGEEKVIRDLKVGQVWAFSEESDGFPCRSYARIDNIVSAGSFVEVTPLVPHPILREEVSVIEKGLSLACGLFQASQSSVTKKVSAFTHNVPFHNDMTLNSYFRVFPRKGEIWAVYSQWDALKKRFEYREVEVVSDFNEEGGVNVFALVGVEGKVGVYRRQAHEGFHLVQCYSRSFMPMFSHRMPACKIIEDGEILWKLE